MSKIRVRFAPSPTGYLHIGGVRTALINYLFARHHGGEFFIRIEDTDRARFVADGVKNILESLAWAGLANDEGPYLKDGEVLEKGEKGPYTQSMRLPMYKQYADQLVKEGKAYHCFCTADRLDQMRSAQEAQKIPPKYDGLCKTLSAEEVTRRLEAGEANVIRFKIEPGRTIAFKDVIRGPISFESDTVDDQVLIKSDGFPTYHLAAIVDDHFMETTHVIRGEEWLSSTPKHILLYEAFGWAVPEFAHLPLLLNPDKTKLSKRQGDVAAMDYAKAGYLSEAVINFLAILGWNPSDSKEIYTLPELIKEFNLSDMGKAGAVFDRAKLDWLNGQYLRALSVEEADRRAEPFLKELEINKKAFVSYAAAFNAARERAVTLRDVAVALKELSTLPDYAVEMLVWKKSSREIALNVLTQLSEYLAGIEGEWKEAHIEGILKEWVTGHGFQNGDVFWPLRVALSGAEKSPPPFTLMEIFGRDESVRRIKLALAKLK
ncbi:MAG: glutamate--tRNA ligase [bacterium]